MLIGLMEVMRKELTEVKKMMFDKRVNIKIQKV